MESENFKYFAFISYNSKDTEWGKCIQRKLESYRMPATVCSKHGWKRTPIKPVFFAPTDIQPGGLTEELQDRLRASRNLVVICSPNSARSEWVGKEIEFFHKLGRTKQIHFFIVDGEPHSGNPETECFNPVIDTLGLPEILGANIHERTQVFPFTKISWPWMDKQRAYVQLISKLLGVEFDAIWQRHKRQLIQKAVAWTVGVIVVMAALLGVWIANQPVDVQISLEETSVHNDNLPPMKDAIVIMTLDNETKTDTARSLDASLLFANIPHRFLNQEVSVTVRCENFLNVDTVLVLTPNVVLHVRRDPAVFGNVHFRIWNPDKEIAVANADVEIAGQRIVSDSEGSVILFVPLENQRTKYDIRSSVPLLNETVSMPCGPDDIVLTK